VRTLIDQRIKKALKSHKKVINASGCEIASG